MRFVERDAVSSVDNSLEATAESSTVGVSATASMVARRFLGWPEELRKATAPTALL